jgi:tRNA (Thr-GGU) A37 N-methylase
VTLLAVDGTTLRIKDLDLLDGTPVLDIKPFVGEFDQRHGSRTGWLEAARARRDNADDRFS